MLKLLPKNLPGSVGLKAVLMLAVASLATVSLITTIATEQILASSSSSALMSSLSSTSLLKRFDEKELDSRGQNIFFVETNASLNGFSARINCAFESAAIHNPDHLVFVLINKDDDVRDDNYSFEVAPNLASISNLHFRTISFSSLANGTQVEELWESGKVHRSQYALNNMSNIVRLLLLYRFGGIYMDTDIISLSHLPRDHENFLVFQSKAYINNAIMSFRQKRHQFIHTALHNLTLDFRGDAWGHQGPSLVTHTAEIFCPWEPQPNASALLTCDCLVILPDRAGSAIPYGGWKQFFSTKEQSSIWSRLTSSFATHYWNHMRNVAKKESFVWSPDLPIASIMARSCPSTESTQIRLLYGQKFE